MKNYHSFAELSADLSNGTITCEEVTKGYIEKIAGSSTNSFLEVFEDSAIAKAKEIDSKIANASAGKLAGLVIGIKDNIAYKNHKVSAASKILEGFESIYNSTAVERLLKEDAIIIGRLNCDEFAMGGSNENSAFGNVLNPINPDYVPGGSSGGSAAAVKEGLCLATLGSDTGGSIRQPASFCGIVGYKPSYGLVSRYGLLAYASSFDQIGPLTNTVEDAALITSVIAGGDQYDSTCSPEPAPVFKLQPKTEKLKIAYIKDVVESEGLDSEIRSKTFELLDELKNQGHVVEAVNFELLNYMVPNYYVLTTAEASSNLARYDGAHFGYRASEPKGLEDMYIRSRTEGFGSEVKRRIMLGTFVLSHGYYDAYYTKALKVRNIIKQKTEDIFSKYDFIVLPTAPTTAFKIGENIKDPITMYLQDIYTVHANLAGVPAISLPLGQHSNGMPFGIQIMAKSFYDEDLLSFAQQIMKQ